MILNDVQIRRYCYTPRYWFYDKLGRKWPISPPYSDFETACIEYYEHRGLHIIPRISPKLQKKIDKIIQKVSPEEKANWKPMIEPFVDQSVSEVDGEKVISYGLSSYGYDFRIAPEFKVFTNIHSTVVDPKNFDHRNYIPFNTDVLVVPPSAFVLSRTLEKINMPDDVIGVVVGKSTIARTGIQTFGTPEEPGWTGYLTLEYANVTNSPVKLYANEGGLQINFYRGNRPETTYSDRDGKGKYQDQPAEVVFPRV